MTVPRLSPPRALVFGEVLIDEHPDRRIPAGAPLHVAAHLAVRGWVARPITRLGKDEDGSLVRRTMERFGIDTSLVEYDDHLPTGVVTITRHGDDHEFTIHSPAAWDAIEGPAEIPAHDVLHYGTLASRDRRSAHALERLLAASQAPLRVLDVNLRPPYLDPGVIRRAVERATVVKLSDGELATIGKLVGFRSPADLFAAGPDVAWVCVTKGASGAELVNRNGSVWGVGPVGDIELHDTVGAGDAFTAGIIDVLGSGGGPEDALSVARELATNVVTHAGGLPTPPATPDPRHPSR